MRKYFVGMLFGFALAFTISAHAEVKSMINAVVTGTFPVTVEGKKLETDAVEIDGSTYLPVRAFGEAVGYDVKFDVSTGVSLEPKQPKVSGPSTNQVPHPEIPPEGILLPSGERMFPTGEIRADRTKDQGYIKTQKFNELKEQSDALQKQIEDIYQVMRPYENIGVFDGKMGPQKEPDDLYNTTKKKRDELITQRDAIDVQLQVLLKQP